MNTDILREQRVRIDELDEQLICLLAERFEITKTVGELKAKAGLPAADPKREKEQIARLHEIARREGMDPVFGEKVFRLIVDEVIRHHLQSADEHGDLRAYLPWILDCFHVVQYVSASAGFLFPSMKVSPR